MHDGLHHHLRTSLYCNLGYELSKCINFLISCAIRAGYLNCYQRYEIITRTKESLIIRIYVVRFCHNIFQVQRAIMTKH